MSQIKKKGFVVIAFDDVHGSVCKIGGELGLVLQCGQRANLFHVLVQG
jgi:hypothetical protein